MLKVPESSVPTTDVGFWRYDSKREIAVTGELNVRFVRPVITNRTATVRAWIDKSSPPYHVLKAHMIQGQQVKAWAIGKFVNQPHLAVE